jgi:hypothetical protein
MQGAWVCLGGYLVTETDEASDVNGSDGYLWSPVVDGQPLPVTEDVFVLREREERLERSRSCEAFDNVHARAQSYIRYTLNSEQ